MKSANRFALQIMFGCQLFSYISWSWWIDKKSPFPLSRLSHPEVDLVTRDEIVGCKNRQRRMCQHSLTERTMRRNRKVRYWWDGFFPAKRSNMKKLPESDSAVMLFPSFVTARNSSLLTATALEFEFRRDNRLTHSSCSSSWRWSRFSIKARELNN